MKTSVILKLTVSTFLALVPCLSSAGEGTNSGGGSGKPAVSFGSENLGAILKSDKVSAILGLNFGIEKVELQTISNEGYVYRITAHTRTKTIACVFEATVWNTDATSINNVNVTDTKVISGCSIDEIVNAQPKSVLEVYASEFAKFPHDGLHDERPYEEYLNIARAISPAKRQEMREYMRTSEPRFYAVYTAKAKLMKDTIAAHPGFTENNALYMLTVVMGFDPNAEGMNMAVLVGLELAPLFIVDAK